MKLTLLPSSFLLAAAVVACSGKPKQQPATPPADKPNEPMADSKPVEPKPAEPAAPEKKKIDTGGYHLMKMADLKWGPFDPSNPKGPEIAVVHGDPTKEAAAFFLRLQPGSTPGLHSHTADYHAFVISGAPRHWIPSTDAKTKPLSPGGYWFQPGGQPHGDECTGKEACVVFLAFAGAVDFTPTPKAKPDKAGAYTQTARKDAKFMPFDPKNPTGVKLAVLSGDPTKGPSAVLLEVPPKANVGVHHHTGDYHAVTLDGGHAHWLPHESGEGEPLPVGTYWFQPGGYDHGDRCNGPDPCHTFVFNTKPADFIPAKK